MQNLQNRLSEWAIEGIPFPRERIKQALDALTALKKQVLEKQVNIIPQELK